MAWQFGPYWLEALIAQGGMGEIHRAYDTRHDRVVALKLLADRLGSDPEFRERFKREAHAAARLREPHVIPIHAYGEIDGRLYLDMRLVEGSDVANLLAQSGPMPPAKAVDVIEQVAQALDAAHDEGLVHRDVKPSNVLLSDGGFVYLVDFGIARAASSSTTLTSTGLTLGTLAYMAPERFDNAPNDRRCDVYSLACVLYQCLTGDKPFVGDTAASLINAHLNYQPPKPSAARGNLPPELDQVVARGMAKDPTARFDSAGTLARAARHALTSPYPVSIPAGAQQQKTGSRARRWAIAAVVVATLGALGTAGLIVARPSDEQSLSMPNESSQPPPRESEKRAPSSEQPPPTTSSDVPPPVPLPPPPSTSATQTSPPPTSDSEPAVTKWCRPVVYKGVERGIGCFDAVGDHLYAEDTYADGMWIRTDSKTDYGRDDECEDRGSKGGAVDCSFNMKESGKLRFQVELWDKKKRVTETKWTRYLPIAQ